MSACLRCVHFQRDPVDGTCAAYSRIPHEIWASEEPHDEIRGDEDRAEVAYEPLPGLVERGT